jgi:hypothetical protein
VIRLIDRLSAEALAMSSEEIGFTRKTNGLVLALIALVMVVAVFTVFRPRRPSPFCSGSGFGVGYGSDGIMVGASPRLGASR